MFGPAAAAEIELTGGGVGADDDEVWACPQALMPGAGRKHRDVAGVQIDLHALFPAEADLGPSACDTQRLMDTRMVVHERVDAIPPKPAPTMVLEDLLDRRLGVSGAIDFDRPPKHHKGERRVIGNQPVVLEPEAFRRIAACLAVH